MIHMRKDRISKLLGLLRPSPGVRDPAGRARWEATLWGVLTNYDKQTQRVTYHLMIAVYEQRDDCPREEGIVDHDVLGGTVRGYLLYVAKELLESGRPELASILLDGAVAQIEHSCGAEMTELWDATDQCCGALAAMLRSQGSKGA